jgi:hypothetical protein
MARRSKAARKEDGDLDICRSAISARTKQREFDFVQRKNRGQQHSLPAARISRHTLRQISLLNLWFKRKRGVAQHVGGALLEACEGSRWSIVV